MKLIRPFTLSALLVLAMCVVTASAQSPCTSAEEYSQLDFWLGHWRVETPKGQLAGHNTIEKILDGCVVLENWEGNGPSKGKSFNYYDASTGKWHQNWVDNFGQPLAFEGIVKDHSIVYRGSTKDVASGDIVLQEMTLKKVTDNEVHQIWKQSKDNGENWNIVFNGIYLRSPSSE